MTKKTEQHHDGDMPNCLGRRGGHNLAWGPGRLPLGGSAGVQSSSERKRPMGGYGVGGGCSRQGEQRMCLERGQGLSGGCKAFSVADMESPGNGHGRGQNPSSQKLCSLDLAFSISRDFC